jgi:hypothetical protein
MPVVVYQASPCGKEHGNFISRSYRAILKRPGWRKRLDKVHTNAGRALPKTDCGWKELDSSMSSDALLMNIFCYPGVTKRRDVSLLLGTEAGDVPEFGFKPRVPLASGLIERTEIDMKLGSVLFEAKLTEADFQNQNPILVERYRDLKDTFECRSLPRVAADSLDGLSVGDSRLISHHSLWVCRICFRQCEPAPYRRGTECVGAIHSAFVGLDFRCGQRRFDIRFTRHLAEAKFSRSLPYDVCQLDYHSGRQAGSQEISGPTRLRQCLLLTRDEIESRTIGLHSAPTRARGLYAKKLNDAAAEIVQQAQRAGDRK